MKINSYPFSYTHAAPTELGKGDRCLLNRLEDVALVMGNGELLQELQVFVAKAFARVMFLLPFDVTNDGGDL